jgi:hypothetical protein
MNEPLAIVIAGIGSAVIAGFIGLVSALISFRQFNKQLSIQALESKNNREHDLVKQTLIKRNEALEQIWQLSYVLEVQSYVLNQQQTDDYVKALMWCPKEIREISLHLLSSREARTKTVVAELRNRLLETATSAKINLL